MPKPKVLILGKLPPPFMGPAIATKIILDSKLNDDFELVHLDTTINREIATMGSWSLAKSWRNFALYFKLAGKIIKHRPKLVLIPISQTTMGFLKDALFILISVFLVRKVLVQLRGSNFKNWQAKAGGMTRMFVKFVLSCASGVIVLGDNLRHLFEDHFLPHQIHVVPNGRQFSQLLVPHDYEPPKELSVLYFANFLPSKGFEDVLNAVRILQERKVSGYKLYSAGSWDNEEYETRCRNLIAEHNLPVEIYPPIGGSAKSAMFTNSHIFVFPPVMPEGHPWVVVEAMASSLPIISTDQGAIVESVLDGHNGYIVAPNAPEQIADKLEALIQNDELRKRMSDNSWDHYKANFTEAKMVENLRNVFYKMID